MSNHIHLLLQAPDADALGRPLRWFMTQTAKTFHKLRNRTGHFWERRYRACSEGCYQLIMNANDAVQKDGEIAIAID